MLPVAALLAAAPFADARARAARGARTRAALAKLSADTVEAVDGLRDLLAFGALPRHRRALAERGRRLGRAQRAEATWEAVAAAVRDLLIVAAVLGVVAAAAQSVTSGRLHGAWAPAAMALALSVLGPVAESARALSQAVALRAAATRVRAAVDAPALAPPPAAPRPLPPGPLGVRLHGLRFDYGGRPVLDGVELTVPPGQTLALVGASGAGKSTCAHLLARFWDPSAGAVQLLPADGDPVDVREVSDAELRRAVVLVGQETPLFHGTLAENLRLAAPEADDRALAEAARRCGVDRVAPLDALVGERGATLSGGQRARVALARALLVGPRVLVLDESTAHLDNTGDAELAAALREEGRTTILIAHRPATIRRADRIAVLEKGRIAEEGTWEELTSRPGSALNRVLTTPTPEQRKEAVETRCRPPIFARRNFCRRAPRQERRCTVGPALDLRKASISGPRRLGGAPSLARVIAERRLRAAHPVVAALRDDATCRFRRSPPPPHFVAGDGCRHRACPSVRQDAPLSHRAWSRSP